MEKIEKVEKKREEIEELRNKLHSRSRLRVQTT